MKQYLTFFALFLFFSTTLASPFVDEKKLTETENLVKAGSKSVTLLGTQVNVGEIAPNFKVVNENFTPVHLKDFAGHAVLISVVPSLDTGVCSLQTKRFNEEVATFDNNVVMLTISNDLPFAQKRFCKIENIDKVKVLSDSVWRDFAYKYGLLIKDMGLLTRAIFVINQEGKVTYKELVANISNHPDYDKALAALQVLITKKTEQTSKPAVESSQPKIKNKIPPSPETKKPIKSKL
ncbi:MAG: lipid hydroperoxide peroxidase [Gammaproteobacteria bacterium]|nr:MAG: lipid hydroperoxide peroxidase [Gammaproteobacteria bacterium]